MDAHEHRLFPVNVAHDHRQMNFAVDDVLEGDGAKASIDCWQISLGCAAHQSLLADAIAHEVSDRDNLQIVLARKLFQLGQARHRPVRVHNLADDASGIKARDARHVNARFRLSGADEHATLFRAQGEDVAGSRQILWARLRVNRRQNGRRAVRGRDARCHSAPRFD
jgi:hypothetical protein